MLDEHQLIVAALRVLMQAAAAEKQAGFAQFAQKMILHAQMEEEILYPGGDPRGRIPAPEAPKARIAGLMHLPHSGSPERGHDRFMSDTSTGSSPRPISPTERMSRPEAIEILRARLQKVCDDERCVCAAAADLGIFCRGLRDLSDRELRDRYEWIARKRPKATRSELERLISLYHVGRQEVTGAALCCDVETREHCGCDGWNRFDNIELERLCLEMTGRKIQIG